MSTGMCVYVCVCVCVCVCMCVCCMSTETDVVEQETYNKDPLAANLQKKQKTYRIQKGGGLGKRASISTEADTFLQQTCKRDLLAAYLQTKNI